MPSVVGIKDLRTGLVVSVNTLPAVGQEARNGSLPTTLATEDLAALLQSGAGTIAKATVATGGTAVNIFSATPTNGFEIINPHASETLYIRENGTATVADNGSNIPIAPGGSYTTPVGYKPTGDVSANATTSGHAYIGRRW